MAHGMVRGMALGMAIELRQLSQRDNCPRVAIICEYFPDQMTGHFSPISKFF